MNESTHITPPSYLPILGSLGILVLAIGVGNWLHGAAMAPYWAGLGFAILTATVARWFMVVIAENRTVLKGDRVLDLSMRWSMIWFIFTEVMFFAAFFGVLFYIRTWVLPQLSGLVESKIMTHELLWPAFKGGWPLAKTPNPAVVSSPGFIMPAQGIPMLNTFILLLSGVTITVSHYYLNKDKMRLASIWLFATVFLGVMFLIMQGVEYSHAYANGLTLSSGIYGNIFFMMTGFHGLHVMIGSIILMVIGLRMQKGHFSQQSHFAFEASAWYWHFVDVVWLALFIFIYWV